MAFIPASRTLRVAKSGISDSCNAGYLACPAWWDKVRWLPADSRQSYLFLHTHDQQYQRSTRMRGSLWQATSSTIQVSIAIVKDLNIPRGTRVFFVSRFRPYWTPRREARRSTNFRTISPPFQKAPRFPRPKWRNLESYEQSISADPRCRSPFRSSRQL